MSGIRLPCSRTNVQGRPLPAMRLVEETDRKNNITSDVKCMRGRCEEEDSDVLFCRVAPCACVMKARRHSCTMYPIFTRSEQQKRPRTPFAPATSDAHCNVKMLRFFLIVTKLFANFAGIFNSSAEFLLNFDFDQFFFGSLPKCRLGGGRDNANFHANFHGP